MGVFEAGNCESDALRKRCGLKIYGGVCSEVWLQKPKVLVASNQTNL